MGDDKALRRYLEVVAGVRGYPYPERLEDWAARFGANASEREAFRQAPDPPPEVPPYRAVPPHDPPAPVAVAVPGNTGIAAIAAAVARGQVDARERVAAALQGAEAQADLHCFTALAKDAAQAPMRPGPLAAVTVGIKDLMRVQGLPLTGGTRALPGAVAAADAVCVRRLRDAGGAIIGTTNLHELAYGITSINPHFGTVANPAAPGRIAGGSSGGSAAAVAAGLVDVALGTDTAGSVRIPAACCGVVGFKPSYGRISTEGVLALGWSLDHVGTFARTVADAAACYAVAAGAPLQQQPPPAPRAWTLLRPTGFFDACDPAVAACLDDLSARLHAAGFRIVSRPLPLMEYVAAMQFFTLCTEATECHWRLLLEHPEGLGADVRVRLEIGQFIPAIDYQRAQRLRQLLRDGVAQAMSDVDALLLPTLPLAAPKLGENDVAAGPLRLTVHAAMTRFTAPFNLTGQPALTLPCGRTSDGVPIGAQLVGRFGDDAGLLALAAAVEQALTGD